MSNFIFRLRWGILPLLFFLVILLFGFYYFHSNQNQLTQSQLIHKQIISQLKSGLLIDDIKSNSTVATIGTVTLKAGTAVDAKSFETKYISYTKEPGLDFYSILYKFVNVSKGELEPVNDIYFNTTNGKTKIYGIDNISKNKTKYRYVFVSSKPISKLNNGYGILNNFNIFSQFYSENKYTSINTSDICKEKCIYNKTDAYTLNVDFDLNYDDKLGYILIDPAFYDTTTNTTGIGFYNNVTSNATSVFLSGSNLTGNYVSFVFHNASSTNWKVEVNTTGIEPAWKNTTTSYRTANSYNTTDPSLVGVWGLNNGAGENATYFKNELGFNNGTSGTPPTVSTSGVVGDAMSFDATQFIVLNDTGFSNGVLPRTISAWLYPATSGGSYHIALAYGTGSTNKAFAIGTMTGSNNWYVTQEGTVVQGNVAKINTWTHITAVYNGTAFLLYENGNLTAKTTISIDTILSGVFYIGRQYTATSYYWNGLIDEVRVYNKTLSPSEILDLYELGAAHLNWSSWSSETNTNPIYISPNSKFLQFKNVFYTNLTGNSSHLINYNVTLFSAFPSLPTFLYPLNTTYDFNVTELNYSALNGIDCWFYNGTVNSTSVDCGINFTTTSVLGSNDWILYANNSANSINSSTKSFTLDFKPRVVFNGQIPADITSTNIFPGLKIRYNITDVTAVNLSTVYINYKTNSTTSDCIRFVNGTCASDWRTRSYANNVSSVFNFSMWEDAVFPGMFLLNSEEMRNTQHTFFSLTGSNNYYKSRFYNFTNLTTYNFYEFMANTSGTNPLNVYYCNTTYLTGNPSLSSNCYLVGGITANASFDHCHNTPLNYSCHQRLTIPLNTTTGKIGTVKVTPISYMLLRGTTTAWTLGNVSNVTSQIRFTSNSGIAWSDVLSTIDNHVHQFDGTETFRYYVCANDTLNYTNCNISTSRTDLLDLGGLPPSAPFIFIPENITYKGTINVTYTESESPNSYPIMFYNISLLNSNFTFNKTIETNNSLNLNYTWDTTAEKDGQFIIRVEVTDNVSQSSFGYSYKFIIDNTNPLISIKQPTNISYTSNRTQLNYTVSDTNINYCWWSNNSGATNYSVTCGDNVTVMSIEGSNTWTIWVNDTINNINSSSVTFTVDTIFPVINMTSPLNSSSHTAGAVDFIASEVNGDNVTWWFDYGSGVVTPAGNPQNDFTKAETLSAKNYNVTIFANDSSGNLANYTEYEVLVTTAGGSGVCRVGSSGIRTNATNIHFRITSTAADGSRVNRGITPLCKDVFGNVISNPILVNVAIGDYDANYNTSASGSCSFRATSENCHFDSVSFPAFYYTNTTITSGCKSLSGTNVEMSGGKSPYIQLCYSLSFN